MLSDRAGMHSSDSQWVEIDRRALVHNVRFFARLSRPASIMPVIKSNAYGHGMLEVAALLAKEKMWGFGVANLDEALALRSEGIANRILVLSYYSVNTLPSARAMRGTALVIHDAAHARSLQRTAKKWGGVFPVHLKIDTGTSRIGVLPKDLRSTLRIVRALPNLRLEGLFSHFADVEGSSRKRAVGQLKLFLDATDPYGEKGVIRHIACTAALLRYPDARLDVGRLGIGLYGVWPSRAARQRTLRTRTLDPLRPVLVWKSRIEQVKRVPAGTRIGYGGMFRTRRPTILTVVPVGYADGYDRRFSNRGMMLVGGKRCPVLGRVCMNLTMVDCTNVRAARAGDTVVIIGRQGKECLTAEEMAESIGTLPYELLARINPTIPRYIV